MLLFNKSGNVENKIGNGSDKSLSLIHILMAWNALVENREDFMEQWTEQLQSENLLEGYRAEKFIEYTLSLIHIYPYELAEYKDAIMAAMLKGTKRHVESMPEKNEKGNAQTGQSHQK